NFSIRPGTVDYGRDYEFKITSLIRLRYVALKIMQDMWLAANVDDCGAFDDIVLFIEIQGRESITYLIQLKHQIDVKNIAVGEFKSKRDFVLRKYYDTIRDIKNSRNNSEVINHVKDNLDKTVFIIYTNRGTNANDVSIQIDKNSDTDAKWMLSRLINTNGELGGHYLLTKNLINNVLFELFLTPYMKKLEYEINQNTYLDIENGTIWNVIVQDYPLLVIEWDEIVICFLNDYINKEIEIYYEDETNMNLWKRHVNEIKKSILRNVGRAKKIRPFEAYKYLWNNGHLPLILQVNINEIEDVLQIIKRLECNIKVIILLEKLPSLKNPAFVKSLKDLKHENRINILKKEVKFQGRVSIKLLNILPEKLQECVSIRNVIYILLGKFNVGNTYESLPKIFIQRTLKKVWITTTVFNNITDEIFVVEYSSGADLEGFRKKYKLKFENLNLSLWRNSTYLDEHEIFLTTKIETIEFQYVNKTVHFLVLHGKDNLEWIGSIGNISNLSMYRKKSDFDASKVNQVLTNLHHNKLLTTVISDNPGMVDDGNRSFLYIIAAWGIHHPHGPVSKNYNEVDDKHRDMLFQLKDASGKTSLHWATIKGYTFAIQILCSQDIVIDSRDNYGMTALHYAILMCTENQEDVISELLKNKPNLNILDHTGNTALHHAVHYNQESCLKLFFNSELANSDILEVKDNEETLLISSPKAGNIPLVHLMLSFGADIKAKDKLRDTALQWTANNGHVDTVDLLLVEEADAKAYNKFQRTPLGLATLLENNGRLTLLHYAAWKGHIELVDLFLSMGTDLEVADKYGFNALMYATHYQHKNVVELLVSKGVSVNVKDEDYTTPLISAADNGNEDIAEFLILKGANTEAKNKRGKTALVVAAYNSNIEVMDLFLTKKANIEVRDVRGLRALHWAAKKGKVQAVECLLENGANLEAQDENGKIPLILAAQKNHISVINALLSVGANVNAYDNECKTLICWAAINGHADVVDLLLAAGADFEMKK
ncbi:hypothetical protein ILUMI_11629, partial [Ignelater luminosus]